MPAYQIVLSVDHRMLREEIRKVLEATPDMDVVGEANDCLEVFDILKRITPDMIISDIFMPNLGGIAAAREIKRIDREIKILILSLHKEKEYVEHVFSTSAEGYLLKEDTDTELFTAIETIRRGGKVSLSRLLSGELDGELIRICSEVVRLSGGPLTNRAREILEPISEGKSNRQITNPPVSVSGRYNTTVNAL